MMAGRDGGEPRLVPKLVHERGPLLLLPLWLWALLLAVAIPCGECINRCDAQQRADYAAGCHAHGGKIYAGDNGHLVCVGPEEAL